MSDVLIRSAELFDELLDSLSDEDFLVIHDSLEAGIGPSIDEFLGIKSYESFDGSIYESVSGISSFSLEVESPSLERLSVEVELSTDLYAANDSPYFESLAA